jgi:acyl carrier protein
MSVKERVLEIVEENSEKKIDIKMNSDLKEEIGIDSFGYLMIVNALEDEYHVHIDETEFLHFRTVSQIVSELLSRYPEIGEN